MSKGHILKTLVSERLTAAAEEIFALFERTIAEYEEELCRCKKENERNQQLLDSARSPRVLAHTEDVQIQTEQPQDEKSDESVKLEEELNQEVTCVVVKSEYEEQHDESESPCSSSAQQMETGADRDDYSQSEFTDQPAAAQTTNESPGDISGGDTAEKTNKCPICEMKLGCNQDLHRHMLVHTGEKPYSEKQFGQKSNLKTHVIIHTDAFEDFLHQTQTEEKEDVAQEEELSDRGTRASSSSPQIEIEIEDDQVCQKDLDKATQNSSKCSKPKRKCVEKSLLQGVVKNKATAVCKNKTRGKKVKFTCSQCKRTFKLLHHLQRHILTHTGERSFSCSVCQKSFKLKQHLTSHMAVHTGERLFSCSVCKKTFNRKDNLRTHQKNHSGSRPFKCPQCDVRFSLKKNLLRHMIVHNRDTTFSCSVCKMSFSSPFYFQRHKKTHKKKKVKH